MINNSPNNNSIILVDQDDKEIGTTDKLTAHKEGLLHRAFSVFIFRKTKDGQIELLLQQRHPDKYHCGGLWTNTCCSHPKPDETTLAGAKRRLQEECGFSTELTPAGSFIYRAELENGLTEHEYDHVFVGWFDGEINQFDQHEIAGVSWVKSADLKCELADYSGNFTPWFKEALKISLTVGQD